MKRQLQSTQLKEKYYRGNQVINKYATILDLVMFVLLVTFKSVTNLLFLIHPY